MKEQGETPSEDTLGAVDANAQPETSNGAPRMDLLVDEHEEEVSENGHTVRHKGIYLLPICLPRGHYSPDFTPSSRLCGGISRMPLSQYSLPWCWTGWTGVSRV